jgi:catechol 2,3-dioxygenase-like lactoylglutathione lyase family enzyme
LRLQHVSIAVPADRAGEARAFYGSVLGLEERDVLPALDPSRFIWYRAGGDCEVHLLLTDEPPPGAPHFCLAVDDVEGLRGRLEAAGVETREATPIVGRPRFTCRDPFGNLIELARVGG